MNLTIITCILILIQLTSADNGIPATEANFPNALQAFEAFLDNNHNLKQAILIFDKNTSDAARMPTGTKQLQHLLSKYRIRVFNLPTVQQTEMDNNFMNLLYCGTHRLGVFIPNMQSVEIQQNIFDVASNEGLFNNSIAWFIVTAEIEDYRQEISNIFGKLNFHLHADITIAMERERGQSKSFMLFDIYKKCRNCLGPVEIELKATWNDEQGYEVMPNFRKTFVPRRRDFGGIQVPVYTTLLNKPPSQKFFSYLVDRKPLTDQVPRKSYRIFRHIAALYNMTLNISYTTTYGVRQQNGTWTGLMGHLAAQSFEFTLTPLRITIDRLESFQFTPQYHKEDINMLLRHPRRNAIRNIFLSPLEASVWYGTLAVIILTTFLMALHIRMEKRQQQQLQPAAALETRFDFIVLITLESIFNQGPESNAFTMVSTRLLVFTSGVFSVILMQYYGAFIVGLLLAEEPRFLTTPKALYESNFDIGMENVPHNFDIFNKSRNQYARKIYLERICKNKPNTLLTLDAGVERIKKGNFAFQSNVQTLYRLLMNRLSQAEFCDLQEIHLNEPFNIASALQKNTSYKEFLAQAFINYRTSGLMDYNNIYWSVRMPACNLIKSAEVEVDMQHFIPLLLFLSYAYAFAFGVFLVELMQFHGMQWWKRRMRKRV